MRLSTNDFFSFFQKIAKCRILTAKWQKLGVFLVLKPPNVFFLKLILNVANCYTNA